MTRGLAQTGCRPNPGASEAAGLGWLSGDADAAGLGTTPGESRLVDPLENHT